MPPAALLIGGLAAGAIGSGFSQSAANKGPRPLFPGLQGQGVSGLSGVAGPGFSQLLSLMKTGNPVATQEMEQGLSATQALRQKQGTAQIRERFGVSGLSSSSPAAVGESNFLAESNADFLNTIAQLRYQSATDAANRELAATEFGLNAFLGPAFTDVGPKGSVTGAVLGSAGEGLSQLGLLKALGFLHA